MFFLGGGIHITMGGGGPFFSLSNGPPQSSSCGADFDEYVKRALSESFPYSSMQPASRVIENLWQNRRFKLYLSKEEFRQGKVVSFKQWNTGPFASTTFWNINVEMDSIGIGDTIQVEGTRLYDGKQGSVLEYFETADRYKIQLHGSGNATKTTTIRAAHVRPAGTTYCINRMNINGGGTLSHHGPVAVSNNSDTLLSLEWIDEAIPSIDLDQGSKCPTCRAVEPPQQTYNDDDESEQECPVCLETKQCLSLSCDHVVCRDCWNQWSNASSGIPISPPQVDASTLLQERQTNYQELQSVLPQSLGGTATNNDDEEEIPDSIMEHMKDTLNDILEELTDLAESGDDGLSQYWRKIMVCGIQVFVIPKVVSSLVENLPIPALKILNRVLPQRRDELLQGSQVYAPQESDQDHQAYFHLLECEVTNRIGERYEHEENYRGAIFWYEQALETALQRLELDVGEECKADFKERIAEQYCNLGLAEKRAGFLSRALEHYDASLEHYSQGGNAAGNRHVLLREMKQWTGTSEKLTPEC